MWSPNEPLRPAQKDLLAKLRGGGCFAAVFPTGYGKSLCFQFPALQWGWRILVVEPLLALMDEQASRARALGLRCIALHSLQSREERARERGALEAGAWDILFASPERLVAWDQDGTLACLLNKIDLLVVDEAHCQIPWSEFRPSYKFLPRIVQALRRRQRAVLALSATLGPELLASISESWGENPEVLRLPLGRENIFLQLHPCSSNAERWFYLFSELAQMSAASSALIYCRSRSQTEEISSVLEAAGLNANPYHAGLPGPVRRSRAESFLEGRVPILVATNAFGMGMDPQRVRLVAHWGMPEALEDYWQEVGRAGRDGKPARAIALVGFWDVLRLRRNVSKQGRVQTVLSYLSSNQCRRVFLEMVLGGGSSERCGACDQCAPNHNLFFSGQRNSIWWLRYLRYLEKNLENSRSCQGSFGEEYARAAPNLPSHEVPVHFVEKNLDRKLLSS